MALHGPDPASHDHQWQVIYVEYDDAMPSKELSCDCGAVSFASI